MQEDLISVIVSVCNGGEHLDRCLESLLNQTYRNIEIILVDNISTDSSVAMCEDLSQQDERIKVVYNQTNSIASGKNLGLKTATGDYITFVNSNNFVDANYLYTLLKNLYETHSDVSICAFSRFIEAEPLKPEQPCEEIIEEIIEKVASASQEEVNDKVDEEIDKEIEVTDNKDAEAENSEENLISLDEEENKEENEEESEEELSNEEKFNNLIKNIKSLEKKKNRSRLVIFEGDDIFEYFFSGVEKVKTLCVGKLYKKNIFKKIRFNEDSIYEDEYIAHQIYSVTKKFVRTSAYLYYYNVFKKPLKNVKEFTMKDLDFFYALENRYNNYCDTKWQQQALNQILTQLSNIYCLAKAGKAEDNILDFLKHKFKIYYRSLKKNRIQYVWFKRFPNLYYYIKCLTTRNK